MNKKLSLLLILGLFAISLGSAALTDDLTAYYKLDGNSFSDSLGINNLTNSGTTNTTGIIIDGRDFDGSNDKINGPTTLLGTSGSLSLWIYLDNLASEKIIIANGWADVHYSFLIVRNTGSLQISFSDSFGDINTTAGKITTGQWYFITLTSNGVNDTKIYINGINETSSGGNTGHWFNGGAWGAISTTALGVLDRSSDYAYFDGKIDEVGIWTRVLSPSEITELYNLGTGLTYPFSTSSGTPQVTLNSPSNNTLSSSSTINFNVTVTDDIKVQNVTLYIDGIANETNSSNYNGTYIFTKSLNDGSYNWSILAYDNESQSTQSATRTFLIDTNNPVISITSPETQDYLIDGKNLTLNFTATDTNLVSCKWEYNGTNTTIPCTSGVLKTHYFNYVLGKNNGTLYVNDSVGRIATSTKSWTYNVLQNSVNYSATTFETATEDYSLNLTLGSGVSLTSAYLNYNGTQYGSNIYSSGSQRSINNSIQIPLTNSTYNATFFWELTTSEGNINTTSLIQTINTLKIDNCAVNTHVILNYTIYDEDTRLFLGAGNNITANLYVQISGDLTGEEYNYYAGTLTTNPIPICVDNSLLVGQNYRLDALVQYTADDYVKEYNYIENYLITNATAPNLVPLYLLAVNNSQEFLITYKDSNLLPVEGAIIELTRQYPELGPDTFLSVENMKTDSDGRTIGHFVLSEEIYTLYVRVDGVLTATYENQRAYCTNLLIGDCTINLNEKSSTNNPSSYKNYLGIIGNPTYDSSLRELSFDFSTVDSSTKTINLSMYKVNGTLTTQTICSEVLTSSAGTITCTIPAQYYNDTALVKILVDGTSYSQFYLNIASGPEQEVNSEKYILAFFLIITLPLLAISSGPMTIVMFIVGLIAAGGLFLVDLGGLIGPFSAFLWIVIAAVILLAKAAKRRNQV